MSYGFLSYSIEDQIEVIGMKVFGPYATFDDALEASRTHQETNPDRGTAIVDLLPPT